MVCNERGNGCHGNTSNSVRFRPIWLLTSHGKAASSYFPPLLGSVMAACVTMVDNAGGLGGGGASKPQFKTYLHYFLQKYT